MSVDNSVLRDLGGGANQTGLRDQNARLILSILRKHGAMPSVEIARRSGLSAQTVSNIIRSPEGRSLLKRGEAVKGKVGKPSVPMALNPDGVHSLGLNIGRRAAELTMVDFNGKQLDARSISYAFPTIDAVFEFLKTGVDDFVGKIAARHASIAGLGVAQPNLIWDWLEAVDAPAEAMNQWKSLDIGAAIAKETGLETIVENDATSACISELLLGRGSEFSDFAYIFLGAFVGGGLVLNGNIVSGRSRNGAALGPMPVPDQKGGTTQLLNVSSIYSLESELRRTGRDPRELRNSQENWSSIEDALVPWLDNNGRYLAIACASIASVVDVEAILIEGAMPPEICKRLVDAVRRSYKDLDLTGLAEIGIHQGAVGRRARSIGAALLPIHAKYFLLA